MPHEFVKKVFTMEPLKDKETLYTIDFFGCSREYLSIIGNAGSEVITKNPEDLEAQLLLMKLVDKVQKNQKEQNIQSME